MTGAGSGDGNKDDHAAGLTIAESLSQPRVAAIQTPTTHTHHMLEGTRGIGGHYVHPAGGDAD